MSTTLSIAYLQEHPVVDGELADIEWLLSIGGEWSVDGMAIVLADGKGKPCIEQPAD